jgi:RNA polymerase sigma-70 factor (ECF subfamily)
LDDGGANSFIDARAGIEQLVAGKNFRCALAATVVERALRRLGDECEKRGRRRVFDVLSSCLSAEREDVSYATFARILGLRETAVKSLVHRLRERYRTLLREEVAETVSGPNEIDDELRYLCAALSAAE